MAAIPFVEARNYTIIGTPPRLVELIVVHDMEYPEKPLGAEWCADFFHNQPAHDPPHYSGSSAHYCIDNNSIVQCVRERDIAWAAPGANRRGIQLEHAGYARQSREDWLDDYSRAELNRSAKLVAGLCQKYRIPVRHITAAGIKDGKRGIVGHHDVTIAYGRSSHTDPGPNFPWPFYLEAIEDAGL